MKTKKTGFQATALQIRRAYIALFGTKPSEVATYQAMANRLIEEMGRYDAERFILSQSNDPNLPD